MFFSVVQHFPRKDKHLITNIRDVSTIIYIIRCKLFFYLRSILTTFGICPRGLINLPYQISLKRE
jgi:hypothetical protein